MIDATTGWWSKEKILLFLLLFIGMLGGAFAFPHSYFSNTNVLIGLCLLPISFFISGPKRNNYVYVTLFALFAILASLYGVRIFYFFALAFYFLWLFELFLGRLNVLILFLIVFMSPFFIQVITILGFPLRLMLSDYAGTLLNLVGVEVLVQGNMMVTDNAMFSVDEACMGLNMLAISMLMGVFALVYRYRRLGAELSIFSSIIFFTLVFLLNLVTNLLRIIILVYFRITPENPMHELIGILSLVVYVVIPVHFFSDWFIRKYGRLRCERISPTDLSQSNLAFMVIISTVVLFVGTFTEYSLQSSNIEYTDVHYGQVTSEKAKDGITKLSTNELLIYVKSIPEFFTGEHTPLMCWKGSGYQFSGVTTVVVTGITVYKGTLVKGGDILYTAWWYSNGQIETISQIDWRLRMLKGEAKFCLVNITAKDEQTLMETLNSMFTTNPILIGTYINSENNQIL